MSATTVAPAVCKRCGDADAQVAWAAWWGRLDLPIVMPTNAEAPLCPLCMTDPEEVAFLAGCHGARILFAEQFAVVAQRIDERLHALLAAQCEAES